jgi:hypothetical protein
MRLYTRTGAVALDDPEYGTFHADENGGFDFPDEVSDRLHSFHHRGEPMWETDTERQRRQVVEEMERRKDPATLLSAVEQLVRAAQATAALTPVVAQASDSAQQLGAALQKSEDQQPPATPPAQAPADDQAKPARKRAAAKPTE